MMQSENEMPAHFQNEDGQGEQEPHLKAPRHVEKLGAWSVLRARHFGLERHATYRARSWMILPDLRMHGAGPDSPGDDSGLLSREEVKPGVSDELGATAVAAEVISMTIMVSAMGRQFGVDFHPADGILNHCLLAMMVMIVPVVMPICMRGHVLHRRLPVVRSASPSGSAWQMGYPGKYHRILIPSKIW
jgi:hypothetical protein